MSPSKAERSTYAATRTNPAKFPLPATTRAERGSVLDGPAGNNALATGAGPRASVDRARVGPSRNVHPHTSNDPSNYLG